MTPFGPTTAPKLCPNYWIVTSVSKHRRCTFNVTFRGVHETTDVEFSARVFAQGECMRVHAFGGACTGERACLRACSLSYPACNVHAPYCQRPLWLPHIFRHYLINGTIFGKMCPDFSLQILFEEFLTVRRI